VEAGGYDAQKSVGELAEPQDQLIKAVTKIDALKGFFVDVKKRWSKLKDRASSSFAHLLTHHHPSVLRSSSRGRGRFPLHRPAHTDPQIVFSLYPVAFLLEFARRCVSARVSGWPRRSFLLRS
jgi:hypothetical protein